MSKTANVEIYNELKRRIVELEYKPGDSINEKHLIEEFNVSRTPVREAIIKLSQIGLLEIRPRIGTFVTQIDLMSVKHAYEVKKNLEGLAAELAAQRASDEVINELFAIVERFEHINIVVDYKQCIIEDQKFHKLTREAANNPILNNVLDELNIKTARFLQYINYVLEDRLWFQDSLRGIATAIKNRDIDQARKATEEHTRIFLEQLSKRFFG
ncbi:GntR family transcriptional regulator [Clostridium sp. 'deep sea']|uniref:GntR family transcriptional regulator n=1 Tax=Clostridium sp. 'deep sea' TaxID=2779445 RepID=UPI0018969120|nr:GntR family transcriptional regulator [Clostridium sp. 'deep sea']QOR36746.1 GntR family transcriptional regulator [Clostridium sp. 'deep sea']